MADIKEVRRQQLRRLVNEHEGMNNLARKLGLMRGAYISQLLTDPPHRELSEKTARKWERILKLPQGWLDRDKADKTSVPTVMDTSLLENILSALLAELKGAKIQLDPNELAKLIAMEYASAAALGRFDESRIKTIVNLIKR